MKFFIAVCLFFSGLQVRAQQIFSLDNDAAYISLLENELKSADNDSSRCFYCFRLFVLYNDIRDSVKARLYMQQGLELSKTKPFLHASSFFFRALEQYGKGDPATEEALLRKGDSLLQFFPHKNAMKVRSYIWLEYGHLQQVKGDEKAAMDVYVNKALPFGEISGDDFLLSNVNYAMGLVFMNAGQRERAAGYLQAAASHFRAMAENRPERKEGMAEAAIVAAENYAELGKTDSASMLLANAYELIRTKPGSRLFMNYYYSEALLLIRKGLYKDALSRIEAGLPMADQSGKANWRNRFEYLKYKALFSAKQYADAAIVLTRLAAKPGHLPASLREYYKDLYSVSAVMGNKSQGFDWALKYIRISDSLNSAGTQKEIVELEKKYRNAENEKKISLLQAEKEKNTLEARNNRLLIGLLTGGTVMLLALAVLSLFYYRNNQRLSAQRELAYQQQLNEVKQQQQLKLAAALLEGEERERKRLAGDLHDGLGGMLAGVKINLSRFSAGNEKENQAGELSKIILQLDNSVNELRRIARNMMPESILNNGLEAGIRELCESWLSEPVQLDFQSFNISKDIPQEMQVTIYRIVQELLTNAVRHSAASEILVQCSQNENTFYITVEDNGRGFDLQQLPGTGMGLANVRNRVDYLKGKMEVDSNTGEGSTINIEFNVAG